MKRFILFSLLIFGLIISSMAQESNKKQNLPRENSKVTREYDEKGNLIRFDSVYSYSYSSDSTLLKNFSPNDFPDFSFLRDSIFKGNSFFDDFDKMFAVPFGGGSDSLLLKPFDQFHNFGNFNFNSDSIASNNFDLDDFPGQMTPNKNDSISPKRPRNSLGLQPKTIEEMMRMIQLQMQEMEEYQQNFFKKQL